MLRTAGGEWRRVARVPTGGKASCYLALDRDRTRLAVANYASGSVASYALDAQGKPLGPGACLVRAWPRPGRADSVPDCVSMVRFEAWLRISR